MLDIVFYSIVEVLSGLAPNYQVFFVLRLLYGIGMGGEWGVGASLAMESSLTEMARHSFRLVAGRLRIGEPAGRGGLLPGIPRTGAGARCFLWEWLPALLSLFIFAKVKETEAWHKSRTDWHAYGNAIGAIGSLFLYMVLLMTTMNCISHGTQDLYPTLLQKQRHFSTQTTAMITMISMVGAIAGGLVFGLYSDRRGSRRSMVTAVVFALLLVPAWVMSSTVLLIIPAAFLMQFMVQGAWGVIPVHLNELSPGDLRGFFPGFAYQLGVLFASSITVSKRFSPDT